MARISITRETKTKLLTSAVKGESTEIWMFPFIRCDLEFQAELFRTAEDVQNWRFLESLSEFREQERRAKLPPVVRQLVSHVPKRKDKPTKSQRVRAPKYRQKMLPQQIRTQPFDPTTLPSHQLIQVKSTDFINCPRCKMRLLKKILNDHLDLSCPYRGKIDGLVTSLSSEHQKVGVSIVFCHCGAPAIPGDNCCYDHKHT